MSEPRPDPLDELDREHDVLRAVLGAVGREAETLAAGSRPRREVWFDAADFLHHYGDRLHHAKEDEALFPAVLSAAVPGGLGPVGAMRQEHVDARAFHERIRRATEKHDTADLADASRGYVYLMRSHIDREDDLVIALARRVLRPDKLRGLQRQFAELESQVLRDRTTEHYVRLAKDLCARAGTDFPRPGR